MAWKNLEGKKLFVHFFTYFILEKNVFSKILRLQKIKKFPNFDFFFQNCDFRKFPNFGFLFQNCDFQEISQRLSFSRNFINCDFHGISQLWFFSKCSKFWFFNFRNFQDFQRIDFFNYWNSGLNSATNCLMPQSFHNVTIFENFSKIDR